MAPRIDALVVDDEPGMRDMLAFELSADGFSVTTAGSGLAAIEAAKARKFDVAVLDLRMPGMDGLETLDALHRLDPELETVIATAYATIDTAVACMRRGAYDYILKPFDVRELKLTLRRALETGQLKAALTLHELSRLLATTLDHSDLTRIVLEISTGTLACPAAAVVLDHPGTLLTERLSVSPPGAVAPECAWRLAGAVKELGRHLLLGPGSDAGPALEALRRSGFGSGLALPLVMRRGHMGTLLLLRREGDRPFAPSELRRAAILASHAALALDNAILFTALQRDEAERAKSEAALQVKTRQLAQAQRLAHVGSWEWDVATGNVIWSDELYRIHGISPDAGCPTLRLFWDHVHPDDRKRMETITEQVLADHKPFSYDYRIVRPDGTVRILHTQGQVLLDETGRATCLLGADQDVTEMRQAEEILRVKTDQLQAIAEATMLFLAKESVQEASACLLRTALSQTQSEYGFIGVLVEGPVLRILAHQGVQWDAVVGRDVYERAQKAYQETGHLDFANLKNLFGAVLTGGRTVLANDPGADPRSGGCPPGHPTLKSFLGVPILRGAEVVGMIGVANRPGGYQGSEERDLEILTGASGVIYDSYRRAQREAALEERLRQSQKMESIGQLAGGIAHDFNNLLGVILGYSEMLRKELSQDPRGKRVEQIHRAADQAAVLTRQLLAFSRRQVLQPRVLDFNAVVSGMEEMLRRLIGEDIDLVARLDPSPEPVLADPGQLEQVIMNLVVNARDAMPQGGTLTIETRRVTLDEGYARLNPWFLPGSYVMLSVSDTGHGMDASTLSRVFEPFFTTKEKGKGTGLGLSTVYGIVKQSGGYIVAQSEPGRGARFEAYLPVSSGRAVPERPGVERAKDLVGGSETILLVEDQAALREMVREILETHGYRVLEARSAEEAISVVAAHGSPVHLAVLDVVLPGVSGPEAAKELAAMAPNLRTLYMSGYADQALGNYGLVSPEIHFLQKPFTSEGVLTKVRQLLDSPLPS